MVGPTYERALAQLVEVGDPPVPQRSSPLTEMSSGDALKHTLTCLAIGLPLGAVSAALFVYGHWFWGTIAGILALLMLAASVGKKSRVAACPYCSATIVVALEDSSDPLQCERCHEYSAVGAGALAPLDPNTISETPRFESPLFANARWPKACVACGAPPTRLDDTKGRSVSAGHLLVGRVAVRSAEAQGIPYCEKHRDGLEVKVGQDRSVRLRWCSLRMMRRYLHANRQGAPRKTGIF